jgi:hypothetical protein
MSDLTNSHLYTNDNIYKIVLSMEDVNGIEKSSKNVSKNSTK